jgi:hypothetical protein
MRHAVLVLCLLLLVASTALAQSTTVTLQVTDSGSQSWNNGTYSAVLTPPPGAGPVQFLLNGVVMTPNQITVSGSLNATGGASFSLSQNSAISPVNTTWTITACPQATASCFKAGASISGATQTVTLTPPAIIVTLANPPYSATAYADSEVTGVVVGSQYYNLTSASSRVCTAVSGSNCTTWAASGGGGSSFPVTTAVAVNSGGSITVNTGGSIVPAGTGAITSTILNGADNSTSQSSSTAGTFTLTQQDPFMVNTNGGGSACSPSNVVTSGGVNVNNKVYDGFTSCVSGPSTNTLNAFSNGVAGLAQINDSGATGSFGYAVGVGGLFVGLCTVSNAHCFGMNSSVSDVTGHTNNGLISSEADVQITNNSSVGGGYVAGIFGSGQATGDNLPAYQVAPPFSTGKWTTGYECKDGSISTASSTFGSCFVLGRQAAAGTSSSQLLLFNAFDGSSLVQSGYGLTGGHVLTATAATPLAVGGLATYLTATATLSVNQLVKIDSANADSVVVCTTTDTQCQGFVAESVIVNCVAANTACPIITTPGSKVKGILGTGTCSIDNPAGTRAFVIVDTTTNGRVKCTTAQPAVGAYIGLAISAQAAVGSTVDILTKFE